MTSEVTVRARRILAFDAAGSACSAALWAGGAIKARRFETMRRGHAERLVPMIEEVMAESGCDYGALDAIAVTCGPGGFTGVRIGLATARGLALARGLPLHGIDNFEAVAAGVPATLRQGRDIAVLLDAKREEFFLKLFSAALEPLSAAACISPAALVRALPAGPLLLAGDAVDAGLERFGRCCRAGSPGLSRLGTHRRGRRGRIGGEPAPA